MYSSQQPPKAGQQDEPDEGDASSGDSDNEGPKQEPLTFRCKCAASAEVKTQSGKVSDYSIV